MSQPELRVLQIDQVELTDFVNALIGSPVTAGANNLSELTDVTIGSPRLPGEQLVFNGSVWTNTPATDIFTIGDGLDSAAFAGSPITIQVDTTVARRDATNTFQQANTFTAALVSNSSAAVVMNSAAPGLIFDESDAAADNQVWRIFAEGAILTFDIRNDAGSITNNWLTVGRSGATAGDINLFGTALNFNGIPVIVGGSPYAGGGGDPDQNLWLNIGADVGGPVAANTTTDTLTIAGGSRIRTNLSGDTVTVNMTGSPFIASGDPDQNLWLNIGADVGGPVAANTTTDTLTIAGGTNVRTNISGDTVTVNMTGSPFIASGDPDQNLWLNIAGDVGGPVAANTTTDTLTFAGGKNVRTNIAGDTITVNMTGSPFIASGDPDQNLFLNVLSDSGTAVADTTTDTLSILGGTGVSTAVSADALTITNDSPNVDQNLFLNVLSDSGTAVADTTTDTLSILGGTGVSTAVSADALTITNDSPNVDQNLWLNIAGDVGGPVAANTTTDTLTIAGGTNVRTNISGDTITVNMTGSPFTGGAGGDFVDSGSPATIINDVGLQLKNTFRLYDSTEAGNLDVSVDSAGSTTFLNSASGGYSFSGVSGGESFVIGASTVHIKQGATLRIFEAANAEEIDFQHDGKDLLIDTNAFPANKSSLRLAQIGIIMTGSPSTRSMKLHWPTGGNNSIGSPFVGSPPPIDNTLDMTFTNIDDFRVAGFDGTMIVSKVLGGSPAFADIHTSTTNPTMRIGFGSPTSTGAEATLAILDNFGPGLVIRNTFGGDEVSINVGSNNEFVSRTGNFTTWAVEDDNGVQTTIMSVLNSDPIIQFQSAAIGDVKIDTRTINNQASSDTGWTYSTTNGIFFIEPNASNINFGGMSSGRNNGQWLTIINAAAGPGSPAIERTITFEHEEGTAVATHRFVLPGAGDIILRPHDSIQIVYDGAVSRWRCMSTTGVQVSGSPLVP